MRRIEAGSYYSYLSEGCKLCRRGSKLVLFVTGVCKNRCFYCPVSREKFGRDVVYANERRVETTKDFLEEVEAMDAEGVAITGGEPLLRINRVREFLELAGDLHVHLYTTVPLTERMLERLRGVDEIRFHPPELRNPEKYIEPIKLAKKHDIEVGFEIPAIRFEKKIVEIVNQLDVFLNVNQLEASESNWERLVERGYVIENYHVDTREVVKAYERAEKFHYCSARFKDIAQFRRRLIRMAMRHPDFYGVTREGTLLCCRIEGNLNLAERLLRDSGAEFVRFDDCIETSPELDDRIREALKSEGLKLSLVERYPTSNRLLIEVIPL